MLMGATRRENGSIRLGLPCADKRIGESYDEGAGRFDHAVQDHRRWSTAEKERIVVAAIEIVRWCPRSLVPPEPMRASCSHGASKQLCGPRHG